MSYKRDTELRKRGRKFRWQNKGEEKGSPQEGLYASTLSSFFYLLGNLREKERVFVVCVGIKMGLGLNYFTVMRL